MDHKNVSYTDCQAFIDFLEALLPSLDFKIDEQWTIGDMAIEIANRLGAMYYAHQAHEQYITEGLYQFYIRCGYTSEGALERLASTLAAEPDMLARMIPVMNKLREESTDGLG